MTVARSAYLLAAVAIATSLAFAVPGTPGSVLAWLFMLVFLGAVTAVCVGIRIHRPPHPAVWVVLAVALLSWAVPWLVWQLSVARTGAPPASDALINLGFLPGYLLLAIAIGVELVRRERSWVPIIDALTLTTAILAVAWVVILHQYYERDGVALTKLFQTYYGIADVLLLSLAARLASSQGAHRSVAPGAVVLGIALVVWSDLVWNWGTAAGLYVPGHWADIGWFLGPATLGALALHPQMVGLGVPRRGDTRGRAPRVAVGMLLVASLVPPLLLVGIEIADRPDHTGAVALCSAAISVLVVARLALVILHQRSLVALVADKNRQLMASEERQRSIIAHSPVGIVTCTLNGVVESANRRRVEMLGMPTQDEMVGRALGELVHPDDRARFEQMLRNLAAGELEVGHIDAREFHSGGSERWVSVTAAVIHDQDRAPQRIVTMAEDITERRAFALEREQLLRVEREQTGRLLDLDRLKDEFVATVSHELRTPLTSICGYLELMLDEQSAPLDPEQRRFMEIAQRNATRLLRLVGDLLFAAQLDAGVLTVERESVDLGELAREAVASAGPLAEASGVTIEADWQEVVAPVDRERLLQVIDNLVSNACKFTQAGGTITVRAWRNGSRAYVAVRDTGQGIDAESLGHVFERFYRADSAVQDAVQGTGLGLSIARAIAEAHGGDIEVVSAVGQGSTFTVWIPAAPVPTRVAPLVSR